jgi:hypothetical protein
MAIPEFDERGLLPVGPVFASFDDELTFVGHDCSLAEIEDRFVHRYPQSHTRPALFNELRRLYEIARQHLDCLVIAVSGDFVTDRENASTLFVLLDVAGPDLDQLDSLALWLLNRLFHDSSWAFTEEDLTIQTGIMRSYPEDHPRHEAGRSERTLQRLLAGRPIPDIEVAGHVQFVDCERGWDSGTQEFEAFAAGNSSPEAGR